MTATSPAPDHAKIGDLAADAGIRRVHVLAWRDLDDVEAGGSEVHAAEVCRAWAEAGLEVTCRTSFAQGHPPEVVRDGYRVVRRAGRYLVFPRAVAAELAGRHGPRDALVEIWNGMPFLSPLWARGPRVTFLHHVHGAMWQMVLPGRLGRIGELVERRLAPPVYRRSRIVTLSASSRDEIVTDLRLRPERVEVVPPGIDPRFRPAPAGPDTPRPLVVAVGRLVPSKHVDELVLALAATRARIPELELVIVGEGYERHRIEAAISAVGAEAWVTLAGRVDDDALVALYQQAGAVVSASSHEGWGMSITEAAACGTPAVVTDIPGHRDAVVHGTTGLLVPHPTALADELAGLLDDEPRRRAMADATLARARTLTWEATATRIMAVLADEARRAR